MKSSGNHIKNHTKLALVGLFVCMTASAQISNLEYWNFADRTNRMSLQNWKPDIDYLFRSRVVNDSTSQAVSDCHIINRTQRTGTVSDSGGDFKIGASTGDSISFSAIGYETQIIALTDTMFNYGYIVRLKPTAYQLSEVTVKPFELELPTVTRYEVYTPRLPNQGGINIPVPEAIAHPITSIYNRFSKEGKQKRHYVKVISGTADYQLIGEKFNGEIVTQLTGLKNDELVQFMAWCNFSSDFLLNYSPETIRRAIKSKYREYSLSNVP